MYSTVEDLSRYRQHIVDDVDVVEADRAREPLETQQGDVVDDLSRGGDGKTQGREDGEDELLHLALSLVVGLTALDVRRPTM